MDKLGEAVGTLAKKVDGLSNDIKEMNKNLRKDKLTGVAVSNHLQELHTAVIDQRALKEKENIVSFSKLKDKHELMLPWKNHDEFKIFEEKLKDSSALASDLVI